MGKLNREALAQYLDSAWNKKVSDASKAVFEILGVDIEEMSTEMNPDVSQVKNILGQNNLPDGAYENRRGDCWSAHPRDFHGSSAHRP